MEGGAKGGYWARTTFIVVGTVKCGLRGDRSIGGSVLVHHLKSDCSKINAQRFWLIPLTKNRHRPKSSVTDPSGVKRGTSR
jgi:hypothetical protein